MTTWLGSENCSICNGVLATQDWFVDGKTKDGPWALMCPGMFQNTRYRPWNRSWPEIRCQNKGKDC